MARGGARSRSGPAPDPAALRRDRKDDAAWTVLPAKGREGELPDWPLTEASDRELQLWRRLWTTPQAAQWETLGQDIEVALYVRRLAEAEQRGSSVSAGTLARQMADALGLTIPGMRVNRWLIAADQVAAKRAEKAEATAAAPTRASARDRFRVVDGTTG